ncbi:EAL domain-containing protein [Simiduia aestuariiviva]|uniref:EAL domain-containing protein (Putative c-di-GMP-specific phosphodiesterase class I) n=1 Tax=Simiduia aestuariiviva TaxID=1510459 RepID=A0A839UQT2_9GAMM|nr:EAL domain-containing protein [Simiduia aestuariiviva]MBB3168839.1 EAL domain-containing protein (putative c-di-GMP-specific phosphodiesterase class I) [Simiduia aestuariiviva]
MTGPTDYQELQCAQCINGQALGFDFSMAFQPIVDIQKREVFAYEALARGLAGESAASVFEHVNADNLYRFDQACRVKAIRLAASLEVKTKISINFMPNAVYRPELCIRTTLAAAKEFGFPLTQIIFEFTEGEEVQDCEHLRSIVQHYQATGFQTAIDDFGAGYAGLNFLADMQTNIIKLDMGLIRNIHLDKKRQSIVRAVISICKEFDIAVIAEGVEIHEEYLFLAQAGVNLFQGYYFARPSFESLPEVQWPH